MLSISATDEWRTAHPGALIGLLEVSGVENNRPAPALDNRKRETEERLRTAYKGFTRQDFLSLQVMSAYERYYKQFKKTYHVQLQVESVVLKGKDLPNISPLVDSNFIAEVETFVLTAGHDAARLEGSILLDVSREGDLLTQMNGTSKPMYPGDMVMRDENGVSCSIIYGQDNRSPISAETTHVLYVAYAPPGVPADTVEAQLSKIEANIRLFASKAVIVLHRLVST